MAFTPDRIHVGPARIFVGVTPGASGTPPTYIAHVNGVPADGIECGLTEGDTAFTYKTTKQGIRGEQLYADVAVFITEEAAELSFTCKEHTYAALQRAFDNVGKEDVAAGMAFYFGGGSSIQSVLTSCVFFSSLQRVAAAKYLVGCLYKAYNPEGFNVAISKTKTADYKVTLHGTLDLTRNAGDQMGYYRWEK
jgi:hypothetical protein